MAVLKARQVDRVLVQKLGFEKTEYLTCETETTWWRDLTWTGLGSASWELQA
jgi:hypothetical protein